MDNSILKAIEHRDVTKRLQTLLGIIAGVMADGQLNDSEVVFLRGWLSENASLASTWPASVLTRKLDDILADGRIDRDERSHLESVLNQLIGSDFANDGTAAVEPTTLPIEDAVTVLLTHAAVCHTGTFYYGTRAACERATLKAGGLPVDSVTRKTEILVIGTTISPAWAHTSFGRKIQAAVKLQDDGHPIEIISEKRWIQALSDHARQPI